MHNAHTTGAHSVQVCPENTEEFIEYLKSIGHLDEAAKKLAEIVNRVRFLNISFNTVVLWLMPQCTMLVIMIDDSCNGV